LTNPNCWEDIRLSDCLKLLFVEILVPTYRNQGQENQIVEFIKNTLFKKLSDASAGNTRIQMTSLFENLVFIAMYLYA